MRAVFRALYGLKEKHIQEAIEERERGGPFQDLGDLVARTHLHKGTLMRLAAAGALDSIGLNAREALWKIQAMTMDAQSLFFGKEVGHNAEAPQETALRDSGLLPKENEWDTLNREYRAKGYSLVRHPLGILRPSLEQWSAYERRHRAPGFTKAEHLHKLRNGERVRVAGLLALQQRPPTAKGFAFLTLEDETGNMNIVIVPQIYDQFRLVMVYNPLLDITGVFEKANGVINIKAKTIKPLPVNRLLEARPELTGAPAQQGFDFSKCFDDHSVGSR